ncbi:MAG: hypothetical protein KDB22_15025 [Planctomycetales bacterium]|nr:hypothetical protein [Planctomycetales bacterium]
MFRRFALSFACMLSLLQTGLSQEQAEQRIPDTYPITKDSMPQDGVPQGALTSATIESKVYDGREFNYQVYVPAQYDGSTPAAVMIFMDGSGYARQGERASWRTTTVLDNLIHRKEIPVIIGVFIDPGSRSTRSEEYDTLSDRYARFVIEEVLVEAGKKYRITDDPDGRATCGLSSGAICAFTMAWERPDAFRKVASFYGSYTSIGFRNDADGKVLALGGDSYPTLIRRLANGTRGPNARPGEIKPLRVFFQDGSNDLNNMFGSWWLANQRMVAALQWANENADRRNMQGPRYEVKFEWGDGGHTSNHGAAILPDVMRWLWKGYQPPADTALRESAQSSQAEVVVFSTQQDHENMMQQLGITRLRPGPSGNPESPNAANTDETLANPFPVLPDLMTLKDGTRVESEEQWWKRRRPEIVEDFEREVLGRVPDNVPGVHWQVLRTIERKEGETDVIEQRLAGRVDNSACPEISVDILMSVVTPKSAQQAVPVLMMFGFTMWGPDGQDLEFGGGLGGFNRREGGPPPKTQQLVEAGWGYATINANSIQEDSGGESQRRFGPPRPAGQTGGGLTRGIIGLTNRGRPRQPDQWGSLRAWAWGASRGLDYLETYPAVDAKRVGIDGVSRYGKAALVTMAFDPRFATVLVGSSGEGGASLYRRNFGEAVENLTGSGEYHWMAGNFLKYGTAESSFGAMNAGDLPVDSHMLIALCAPRPTFISYGVPERGDALWLDQQGSFMAAIAAQPAFRLLGARDLGRSDDYTNEKMPPVNTDMLDGELAWRQHDGGHTDGPNIPHFIAWMEKLWSRR